MSDTNVAALYRALALSQPKLTRRPTGVVAIDLVDLARQLDARGAVGPPDPSRSHTEADMDPEVYRWFCSRMGV